MNDKHFAQSGGEGSENYQAANNLTVNRIGLSFTEAKDLIMLMMEQNFIKFSEQALTTARARAEEMTTAYLDGLANKNPELVEAVQQPGVQMALVVAQKEYIKTGDIELAELLVEVLVERTNQPQRTILQIALDESIAVLGKLTNNQINQIILNFYIFSVRTNTINSLESFKEMCESQIKPLIESIKSNRNDLAHIIGCNCGLLLPRRQNYLSDWQKNYTGLFSRGFEIAKAEEIMNMNFANISIDYPELFVEHLHNEDSGRIQIGYLNETALEQDIIKLNLDNEIKGKLKALFLENVMSTGEIHDYLNSYGEYMNELHELMYKGTLSSLSLNTVGQAIAITAYNKKFNYNLNYSLWLPN